MESLLFVLLSKGHDLCVEEDFDAAGGPDGDAGSKEVGVFGPQGAIQSQCGSKDGPIHFVTAAQAFSRLRLEKAVGMQRDGFHKLSQIAERGGKIVDGLASFDKERRQVFFGVREGSIGSKKSDGAHRVLVQKLPDAAPKNSTNEDVGVEDNHPSLRAVAVCYATA